MLSKRIRIISISLVALLGVALLGLSLPIGGWNTFSVQTGSMEPAIKTGSLVFVHRTPAEDLRPGDVITYTNPADKTQTITHRLIAVKTNDMGSLEFIAQGDANKVPDEPVTSGQIVGTVQTSIPFLGKVSNFVLNPVGLALLIYVPALAVVIEELKRLSLYYRSQKLYRLEGYNRHAAQGRHIPLVGTKIAVGIMILSLGIAVPVRAALQSQVTITGNTISSVSSPQPPDPSPDPDNQCAISSSNNVTVTNSTNQSASTGDATNSNNTNGGNAASGDASNSSSTSTTILMNNGATCP